MDAQTRRRERRSEKQAQWKAANPLLVGVSAKPVNHQMLRAAQNKAVIARFIGDSKMWLEANKAMKSAINLPWYRRK